MSLVQEHHARSYSRAPCKTCGAPGKICAWCWDGAVYLNIFLVHEHYARSYSRTPCKTLRLLLGQSCGRAVHKVYYPAPYRDRIKITRPTLHT